jgi:hypothetical protein
LKYTSGWFQVGSIVDYFQITNISKYFKIYNLILVVSGSKSTIWNQKQNQFGTNQNENKNLSMILRITSSFGVIGNKIQQLCIRYPWLVRIYGFFFDYSSRITYLFLITRGGLAFNLVFPTLMTVFHFREFVAFYSQIQIKGWVCFYSNVCLLYDTY